MQSQPPTSTRLDVPEASILKPDVIIDLNCTGVIGWYIGALKYLSQPKSVLLNKLNKT